MAGEEWDCAGAHELAAIGSQHSAIVSGLLNARSAQVKNVTCQRGEAR
jgi:hypothetical protein